MNQVNVKIINNLFSYLKHKNSSFLFLLYVLLLMLINISELVRYFLSLSNYTTNTSCNLYEEVLGIH